MPSSEAHERRTPPVGGFVALAALGSVIAVACLLRFWDLASNPGGLYGDEAAEGLDALRLLHQPGFHADWLVWFPDDGGREALFAYVVAVAFHFLGETVLVLRTTAAAFGVAGVLAIAALAGRWGRWPGLVAGGWAAGSLWLVAISRDGMRNTIVPMFGALALIALLHWASRPSRRSAALAGAVTALAALYTYQPLKLLPLLVVAWLLWLRHANRPRYDRLRPNFVPLAASFLVVAAPMLAVAMTEPLSYFGRSTEVSVLNPAVQADADFPTHVLRTMGMFGFLGDQNGRHDVAALPLLPLPLVAVAAVGALRLWRGRRDPADSLVLLSLPIFLLAPLLASEGYSPHFLRALGLAAPLGVAVGLGAQDLVERARAAWGSTASAVATGLAAVTLAAVAAWSGFVYLGRSTADRYDTFTYDIVAMARLAQQNPRAAVVVYPYAAYDIGFLDCAAMPDLVAPGTPLADPSGYRVVVALSRADLVAAVGPSLSGGAQAVEWDPSGKPRVWAVWPGNRP